MTEPKIPNLYASLRFTDRLVGRREPDPEIIHLCRDYDGSVLLAIDSSVAKMDRDDVKWLSSQLISALDNWPVTG